MSNIFKGRTAFKTILLASAASLALNASPVMAQDSTSTTTSEATTVAKSSVTFKLDVGAIDAVDSNVDAMTIRNVISGELAENANALAGLNAKSIFIPEITLTYTVETEGNTVDSVFRFKNIALTNVQNGTAQTASMEAIVGSVEPGAKTDKMDNVKFNFGQTTITQLNLGALLNVYGLVEPKSSEMATVYKDMIAAGGTLDAGPMHCDIGKYTSGEYRGRAMEVSYKDIMALGAQLENSKGEPSPAQLATMFDFYADILYAVESSPIVFEGISCAGTSDDTTVDVKLAGVTMGAMGNGIYPEIAINGLDVNVSGKENAKFKLGNLTFKEIDFAPTIEAYDAIEDISVINEKWMEENFRSFIPSWAGMSFGGLAVDFNDPETGEQIDVALDNFDISLGAYENGIPSDISMSMAGLQANLPKESSEKGIQQLLAMGIDRLNLGYELSLYWDAQNESIELTRLMATGENMGTVDISGQLLGASEDLFATNMQQAMIAAMSLGIKEININLDNQGFLDLVLQSAAAEQGAPVEAFQTQVSAMAQGMIVGVLGGVDQAVDLGDAVSSFVKGETTNLDVSITAKSESGLVMPQIMSLQTNPAQLLDLADVVSSAK